MAIKDDPKASPMDAFTAEHRRSPHPRFGGAWDDDRWIVDGMSPVSGKGQHAVFFGIDADFNEDGAGERYEGAFGSFARAMINAYAQRFPVDLGSAEVFVRLALALRHLYAILPEDGKDPVDLIGMRFAAAEQAILDKHHRTEYAGTLIGKLQHLAITIDSHRLTRRRLEWRRSFYWNREERFAVEAMDKHIAEMLLTEDDMLVWARLSAKPGDNPFDLLRQRAVDLMICGAFRIHEVLTLPYDTLVKEEVYATDEDVIAVSDPVYRYGLRYWPHKGGEGSPLIKAVPTILGPIAERAVMDIRKLTRRARAVALAFHEERTPFDEDPWDLLSDRDYKLSYSAVGLLTGRTKASSSVGESFVRFNRIPTHTDMVGNTTKKYVWKSDLEAILKKKSFDKYNRRSKHGDILLHDCLFVVHDFIGRRSKGIDGTATIMGQKPISIYLKEKFPSRLRYVAPGAASVSPRPRRQVSSHMLRKSVGTLALENGLPRLDLAVWLDHQRTETGRYYDLRRLRDRADALRAGLARVGAGDDEDEPIVATESFRSGGISAGHATALGVCSHRYQSTPCSAFLAMLEAKQPNEGLDDLTSEELADLTQHLEALVGNAKAAVGAKTKNAEAWLEVAERNLLHFVKARLGESSLATTASDGNAHA